MQIRQGDVFLQSIDSFDSAGQPTALITGGVYVLARGLSGHEHVVSAETTTLYLPKDSRPVLVVRTETELAVIPDRARHTPLVVPEGIYEVRRQREATRDRPRVVAD